MATTTTHPMTVEEFRRLPETGPFYCELRHGEAVRVFTFRPLPEHEVRVAGIAYVSRERWEQTDPEDNLRGAPDLVLEVLSRSNTAAEVFDKEKLCLENGCREFWVVDSDRRQVKLSTPDGITTTYRAGQEIPLRLFGGGALQVEAIFA